MSQTHKSPRASVLFHVRQGNNGYPPWLPPPWLVKPQRRKYRKRNWRFKSSKSETKGRYRNISIPARILPIHGHFFQREPRVFMSLCLSWSGVYHFFITGRHWFVKMYGKTVAFKRFLNIKVTSLLKYKEKTLQCSDKGCRAMNHQYSRVAWQFWMRARQELQQKVMPRCTLNYYIIIIDFRDMGGVFP